MGKQSGTVHMSGFMDEEEEARGSKYRQDLSQPSPQCIFNSGAFVTVRRTVHTPCVTSRKDCLGKACFGNEREENPHTETGDICGRDETREHRFRWLDLDCVYVRGDVLLESLSTADCDALP